MSDSNSGGKGRPTPKRKEQQARHKRPLVANSRASAAAEKARRRERENREFKAMQSGDERYMPPMHQGAARRFARDFIDARWNLGESLLPVALISLGAYFVAGQNTAVAQIATYGTLLFILAFAIEAFFLVRIGRKRAIERFGLGSIPPRFGWYIFIRITQFRPMRMPRAQVKRGEPPR